MASKQASLKSELVYVHDLDILLNSKINTCISLFTDLIFHLLSSLQQYLLLLSKHLGADILQ